MRAKRDEYLLRAVKNYVYFTLACLLFLGCDDSSSSPMMNEGGTSPASDRGLNGGMDAEVSSGMDAEVTSGIIAGTDGGMDGGSVAGSLPPPDLGEGQALYQQFCGFCHGEDGTGYLADNANALSNPDFLSVATDEFLTAAIIHGRPGTPMSPWGTQKGGPLTPEMTRNIVAYIGTWRTEPLIEHPAPDLEGSAQRGQPLYRAVCSTCHGETGEGISAVSLNNPWFLNTASDGMISHAIEVGRRGTAMGSYGPPLVTQQGLADLVALIRSWQRPVDTEPPPPFTPQVDQAPLHPEGPEPSFELREDRFVSSMQVYEAMRSGVRFTLIDARPAADYLDEHIEGAISLPFYQVEEYGPLLPSDAFTITYCGCPHAVSGQAADALKALGFDRVAVLDEGFYEWRDTFGYPTLSGTNPSGTND